jgi:hypothetical protein
VRIVITRAEIGGSAGRWLAGFVFTLVGGAILWSASRHPSTGPGHAHAVLVMRGLGALFLALGVLVLAGTAAATVAAVRRPEAAEAWGRLVNVFAGILGALAFAVPATLALPFYLAAYGRRPNALFPDGASPTLNFVVAGTFSLLGLLSLLLVVVMARAALRARRRRGPPTPD